MKDLFRRYQKALSKAALVLLIGWSFVNAVNLTMQLLKDDDDGRDHHEDLPEPPPDDGLKASPHIDDGVVDLSREEVARILADKV